MQRHVDAWLRSAEPARSALRAERAGGSGFAQTALVFDERGVAAFVKWGAEREVFEAEALALVRLAGSGTLRVPGRPAVLEGPNGLIMEGIPRGEKDLGFDRRLGRGLARLHRACESERFGFEVPTFLGATRQANDWLADWSEFFLSRRLEPLLRAVRGRSDRLDGLAESLLRRARDLLEPLAPTPRLVHGDLWSGNVLCDERGEPVLIDPAACYAHHELELGMTSLFGGFGRDFYDSYHEVLPRDPGTSDRVALYRLLHLLNHVSLFGGSYLPQCLDLARRLC
ncbi:MAG: fructosamine kinase family protein [Acidobacteriota bacterium]